MANRSAAFFCRPEPCCQILTDQLFAAVVVMNLVTAEPGRQLRTIGNNLTGDRCDIPISNSGLFHGLTLIAAVIDFIAFGIDPVFTPGGGFFSRPRFKAALVFGSRAKASLET